MSVRDRSLEPGWYSQEAETFVTIMAEMAPDLALDYSAASLELLESFIAEQFDPPGVRDPGRSLPIGVGCYLGEVIRRTLGGHWNSEGRPEIDDLGQVSATFPIQKADKRFANGPVDSLTTYYRTLASHAHPQE